MPSINEACEALATVVGSIDGLRAKGYADDQINPDEAQVYTQPYDPRMVFGRGTGYGPTTYLLGVRLFVSRNDPKSAQKKLRGYMESDGATSVLAKIEDDASWSEPIDDAEVTNIGQPFEYEIQNAAGGVTMYWAVDFDVTVIW